MIKIAIFDDHKHRRDALKLMISLRQDMECIGDYEHCIKLVEYLRNSVPDVVLMDINMPGMDGIEGVKLLKKHYPATLIIMQTIFEDEEKIFNALLAGADGYILKNAPNDKLIEGIIEVVHGGAPMTPSIAKQVLGYFNKRPDKANQEVFNLSNREMDILHLLVKGYSHKMIASALFIAINTVNNHIKSIYQKLHVHSVSEAVATAIQKKIV
ncbi:two component transcriptional regulator, LuxR family [Chitinophaga costaii]|uniref:Two component transcriptional regulator, LuxR family n=1 Tax=Chitinophaga costaii TaxID=1335309 RepID=A0A1C4EJ57_9BACT|nr:response regulator transcription factor [Chitinophaga costaii]PUZ23784.1 DNA-binding response regulator [Chitinophaga costaii]SCC43633.1 two component transcriptional regulator, LuxR family [Chitinophaga costaii]